MSAHDVGLLFAGELLEAARDPAPTQDAADDTAPARGFSEPACAGAQVQNLHTHFFTHGGVVKAVDGVDFHVAPGEVLGLVGESGSGKTITGFSIMGLIDPPGRIVDGSSIRYAARS